MALAGGRRLYCELLQLAGATWTTVPVGSRLFTKDHGLEFGNLDSLCFKLSLLGDNEASKLFVLGFDFVKANLLVRCRGVCSCGPLGVAVALEQVSVFAYVFVLFVLD